MAQSTERISGMQEWSCDLIIGHDVCWISKDAQNVKKRKREGWNYRNALATATKVVIIWLTFRRFNIIFPIFFDLIFLVEAIEKPLIDKVITATAANDQSLLK